LRDSNNALTIANVCTYIMTKASSGKQAANSSLQDTQPPTKIVALIVAHPDDETLWAGGTVLSHPSWQWFIVSLCRGNDPKRAPRFYETLKLLRAKGAMGVLDDGAEQVPLDEELVERTILELLPPWNFDLIITHNPSGEYTRHIRHEETSKAVINLWHAEQISAHALWTFAYEDGNKEYLPRARKTDTYYASLPGPIWQKKYDIMTKTYGFDIDSWEAQTTPKSEAFWQFSDAEEAILWLEDNGET